LIDLRNHKNWDAINGTLSVSYNPKEADSDSRLHVVLNGSTGNFCLDYTDDEFDKNLARNRAWSSDTGYYVKITDNDKVIVTRWWDDYKEEVPYNFVQNKPSKFYEILTKNNSLQADTIISFAKETFIKLRNCISQSVNGNISLRAFMHLLASLDEGVNSVNQVNLEKWNLKQFDSTIISQYDWEWLYEAFNAGANERKPDIKSMLRHASNRLFQEAHREATRKDFQLAMFGGANRRYNEGISDGAFYTPTPLVRTIVQEALWALDKAKPLNERTSIKILDPACGSSEFLREALRQLKIKDFKGKVSVTGWDISSTACEMSNFVLHYENNTEWNGKIKIVIEEGDSLIKKWDVGFYDLVLMNPPFLAFEHLQERKTVVLKEMVDLKTRQPDMAAVFLKKAAEVVNENGVLGLVLPHSLIGAETYKNLRNYLVGELDIDFSLIARLGSAGLFEKAMIIPSVLVGIKQTKAKANTILWTDHQQSSVYTALRELRIYRYNEIPTPVSKDEFSIYENELFAKSSEKWNVKSFKNYQLLEKLKDFTTVGKLFNVKRGADSGNNAAFLLTKDEWLNLPKKEQSYFRPCIMRDSLKSSQLNDSFYLFYPYGDFRISNEEEFKTKLTDYTNKKITQKIILKLKARRGRSDKWWELNEHRPWQLERKPKLITAYFGKAGYFAFDKTGEYLVGQSYAWLPKSERIDNDNFRLAYLALLHAPLINKLLEMVCNVLDGGYYDLSKHYVDSMPLPDLSKVKDQTITEYLTATGEKIYAGKEIEYEELNQVVANAYGVNIEYFL
jgi:adenine-specific DNA-methyltransferase